MRTMLKEIYTIWINERPGQLAAALAYYGMFSFAPVIYLAFVVAGFFVDQLAVADQLFAKLQKLLGPETAALVRDLVLAVSTTNNTGTILVSLISFLAICFAASGLFFQLQYALNTIWRVPPPEKAQTKDYIRKRLFSFVLVIGVGLLMIAVTLANVIMTWFGTLIETLLGLGNTEIFLTWLSTLVLTTLSFALLYKVLPDIHIDWRDVWTGAFIAALLIKLAGSLATFYFSFSNFGTAFGAAGAFTVLVMAIFYFAEIFLMGAVITRVTAARNQTRRPQPELVSQPLQSS